MFRVFGNSRSIAKQRAVADAKNARGLTPENYEEWICNRSEEVFEGMKKCSKG